MSMKKIGTTRWPACKRGVTFPPKEEQNDEVEIGVVTAPLGKRTTTSRHQDLKMNETVNQQTNDMVENQGEEQNDSLSLPSTPTPLSWLEDGSMNMGNNNLSLPSAPA